MPYEIFLALRYLRARRKRRLARVTALMALLGIAMGVAALIVALAIANGFRDEMREKILQGTAHLTVLRSDGGPIDDHAAVAERLRRIDGVMSASVTTYDGALARGPKDSAYAVLRGIENNSSQAVQAQRWLTGGSFGPVFKHANSGERSSHQPAGERSSQQPASSQRSVPQVVLGAELAARI